MSSDETVKMTPFPNDDYLSQLGMITSLGTRVVITVRIRILTCKAGVVVTQETSQLRGLMGLVEVVFVAQVVEFRPPSQPLR